MAETTTAKPAVTPVQIGGESFLERLTPHIKKIAIGIVVIAAILAVVFGLRWKKQRGQEASTQKMIAPLAVASQPIRDSGASAEAATPSFATRAERSAAVLDALAKNGAADPTGMLTGRMLLDAGKFDEAIAAYGKGAQLAGTEGALAREGIALAREAKAMAQSADAKQKGLEEALAAFKAVAADEKAPRYAYAMYHQGRILALLEKPAEARDAFTKAKSATDASDLQGLIENRLAELGAK